MIPAFVGRLSLTGELGYEIWVTSEYQRALFDLLQHAGQEWGLVSFGGRALNCLRIEKGFGTWAREFRPIYGPYEAGLGRFVDLKKGDFIGRQGALQEKETGGALRLVSLAIENTDADCVGDEPIWHDGQVVGWVTSGAYGHTVGQSLALGYVPAGVASATELEVEIIGERRKARCLTAECLTAKRQNAPAYDPSGARMRV
jgi:dimethylglycine dehydrogenase